MNEIKQTLQQDADALLKRLQQSRKNGTGVTLGVSDVGVLCEVLGGGGWISVEDKWPKYGESILIVINGVVQNVTYFRDGSDDSEDWCEPVYFAHDDCGTCWWSDVTHWMPLPKEPSHD